MIKGFPGLINTIGTLLDRSRVILQKVKKTRKWGPHGPQGDHGPGPQGPWAQKNKEILKMGGFVEREKDVRRNSVPGTVLNNLKSLIWNQIGAKTIIGKVSINGILC